MKGLYIVETDSEIESCADCPFNYDYCGCRAFVGPANEDPLIDWEMDGSHRDRRPLTCPIVSVDEVIDNALTFIKERILGIEV